MSGSLEPGKPIAVRVDEVLTQDATGTMAYLEFEALGIPRMRAPLVVSYVDHNTLQADHKNFDDHRFLQTAAARFGAWFSRPGNGISHQVHLERFGKPGDILLGSDSHTPTAGGLEPPGHGGGWHGRRHRPWPGSLSSWPCPGWSACASPGVSTGPGLPPWTSS